MKIHYIFFLIALSAACKTKQEKPFVPPVVKKSKDTSATQAPAKGPIINIIDTVQGNMIVACIKDSAATSEGLSAKLAAIYNRKLPDFAKANKIKIIGQPVAWYKTQKAPYFFEAGLPIDKAPAKIAKPVYIKRTGKDSCYVAHFFGPYELTGSGYDALAEFLKDRKKKRSAPPYEIYINNLFDSSANRKIDPYRLQTDIVMPYR